MSEEKDEYQSYTDLGWNALHIVLSRITFKNPPFPIALHWKRLAVYWAEVQVDVDVHERETGSPIRVTHTIKLELITADGREYLYQVSKLIQDVFIHELRECFHVSGRRVQDPHEDERGYLDLVAEREA
jgi:hypothetical protein